MSTTLAAREPRELVQRLRQALGQTFAAERRLRGRSKLGGELGYGQIRSLMELGRAGGSLTAGELARSVDLNPASVTTLLDHLESAGLVERGRSSSDRRVCNVALTPAGRGTYERHRAVWEARWQELLDGFTDEELTTATRVLEAVAVIFDPDRPS